MFFWMLEIIGIGPDGLFKTSYNVKVLLYGSMNCIPALSKYLVRPGICWRFPVFLSLMRSRFKNVATFPDSYR